MGVSLLVRLSQLIADGSCISKYTFKAGRDALPVGRVEQLRRKSAARFRRGGMKLLKPDGSNAYVAGYSTSHIDDSD